MKAWLVAAVALWGVCAAAQARAQEVDILDGLLRESACVAWREDGPGRAQVGCLTVDLAHCQQVAVVVGVGAAAAEAPKEDYLSKDTQDACGFEGNAALLRASLEEAAKGWRPLPPALPEEKALQDGTKARVWGPYNAHAVTFDGKRYQLIDAKTKKAADTWAHTLPPEGVWLVQPLGAYVILTNEIIHNNHSQFTFKVLQPPPPKPE